MVRAKSTVSAEKSTPAVAIKKSAPAPKKTEAKKEAAPVAAPAPVVAPVVETEVPVEAGDKSSLSVSLLKEIEDFNKNFAIWQSTASAMKQNIRNISKLSARVSKNAEKSTKRKKNTQSGKLSGFEKPTLISDELATFLGKTSGTEMARTEVTREINKYIRAHNLQDSENGRKINPDKSLRTLLKIPTSEQLTYFNLQRYRSPHFAKMGQNFNAAS